MEDYEKWLRSRAPSRSSVSARYWSELAAGIALVLGLGAALGLGLFAQGLLAGAWAWLLHLRFAPGALLNTYYALAYLTGAVRRWNNQDHSKKTYLAKSFGDVPRPWGLAGLNQLGGWLQRVGVLRPFDLSVEGLEAEAIRLAGGLTDFGTEAEVRRYREGLARYLAAVDRTAELHFMGRSTLFGMASQLLQHRLLIQDQIKRNPEILQERIDRPVFVLGLPRTGTTFLFNLLSTHPRARPLWSHDAMFPGLRRQQSEYIARVTLEVLHWSNPGYTSGHEIPIDGGEECVMLQRLTFVSSIFTFITKVPDYLQWSSKQDMTDIYEYQLKCMKLLQWRDRDSYANGFHWLLKAPAHLSAIAALNRVFPDARMVWTHRDPLKTVSSLTGVAAFMQSMFSDSVDVQAIQLGGVLADMVNKGIDERAQLEAEGRELRIFDMQYEDLRKQPLATVRRIYDFFGMEWTPEIEDKVQEQLVRRPQHKLGEHLYSFKHFGLDPAAERARFRRYTDLYQIPMDPLDSY